MTGGLVSSQFRAYGFLWALFRVADIVSDVRIHQKGSWCPTRIGDSQRRASQVNTLLDVFPTPSAALLLILNAHIPPGKRFKIDSRRKEQLFEISEFGLCLRRRFKYNVHIHSSFHRGLSTWRGHLLSCSAYRRPFPPQVALP
jgi:hypothetical protein